VHVDLDRDEQEAAHPEDRDVIHDALSSSRRCGAPPGSDRPRARAA
jgi:hypothetical protein